MADTLLVKIQTADRFGTILQCSDDTRKLPSLKEYCEQGWEIVCLTAETHAAALAVLRKAAD
jgi:hypothetical protein